MKKKAKKKVEKKRSKKQGAIFANNRKNVEIKNIDFNTVYELAQYQCSKEEIYRFLKINKSELFNEDNIEYLEEFNFNFEKGKNDGLVNLKKDQFKMSKKNVAMLIFLGKQYLNQSDNPIQLLNENLGTLKVEFVNSKDLNQDERLKEIEEELKEDLKN